MVSVAQLVERWIVAPVAAGSIPVAHPSKAALLFGRTLKLHRFQGLSCLVQLRSNRRQPVLSLSEARLRLISSRLIRYGSEKLIGDLVHLQLQRPFLIREVLKSGPYLCQFLIPLDHRIYRWR